MGFRNQGRGQAAGPKPEAKDDKKEEEPEEKPVTRSLSEVLSCVEYAYPPVKTVADSPLDNKKWIAKFLEKDGFAFT